MAGETGTGREGKAVARRRGPQPRGANAGWVVLVSAVFGALQLPTPLVAQVTERVSARLSGVVFDSVGSAPLANAVVQLVPVSKVTSAHSRHTDARGAFAFDSLDSGRYLLGFYHPLLDSLGVTSPTLVVDVRTSGEVRAPLAIPSARTILVNRCGPESVRDSTGVMIGFVRSATDGMGRARATVKLSWSELVIASDGIRRAVPSISGETSEAGGVALCGIPIGGQVMARAWSGSDSSGFAELEVPRNGLLRRDLYVGSARMVTVRDSTDSAVVATSVLRGDGTLRGEIRSGDGRPLPGARIVFWGTGIEANSAANGAYQLRDLPVGTYTVEARALGFLPERRAVDILATGESVANLTLDSFGTYLDTVKVTTQRIFSSRAIQEFEQRKKRGFGYFLDEDAINKRNPFFMADLLRTMPGVTVAPSPSFGSRILMRGSGFQAMCSPTVYIDGMRVFNNDGDLDAIVNVQDVRAMEVYTRGSSVPIEFQNLDGCGSLVLWTGGRRPSQ